MKFTRKNIFSIVLSLVMMFSLFVGVTPVKASAAAVDEVVYEFNYVYNCMRTPALVDKGENITLYDFKEPWKTLDTATTTYGPWKLTYAGKYDPAVHTESKGKTIGYVVEYIAGEYGVSKSSVDVYKLSQNGTHICYGVIADVFEDSILFIGTTRNSGSGTGYYMSNGLYELGEGKTNITRKAVGDVSDLPYKIKLDKTNYKGTTVTLTPYDNLGSAAGTAGDVVAMPTDGKVVVKAADKFKVEVTPAATVSARQYSDTEGYYYEITGITADTTVAVTSVYDVTLDETNYTGTSAELVAVTRGDAVEVTRGYGVIVKADGKFEVAVTPATTVGTMQYSSTVGYYYEITDIKANTTVAITSLYDITLDAANTTGTVGLTAYNAAGNLVDATTSTDNTVTMPFGGKVSVTADGKFEATVAGTTYTGTAVAGGYQYELTGITADTTVAVTSLYDITLDRTAYSNGYVELFTYDSSDALVASTETDGDTIILPYGGTVVVKADAEFTATAAGTTYASESITGVPELFCEITNITADTTVEVEKVPHSHLWGYNTQYDASAHWDFCHVCGAQSGFVAHSDPDGDGYCMCGWHISETANVTAENPKDDVPNTSHSNIALFAFLAMVLSGSGIVFYSKRKNAFK